ncbi:MAG: nucleoside triphosphate pyrophosphohydrolase [Bryobacteraceae bacterium]
MPSPQAGQEFQRLVELMAKLRAPGGCPWDREQTFDSIKRHTLEETYEVMEAIEDRDWPALCDELGDLLLQPVFYSQMASEEGLFAVEDSLRAINEKLVRRHPHIFGDVVAETADAVLTNWDAIKRQEKADKPAGLLDGIAKTLPAVLEAKEISSRAAKAGFDWENAGQVVEKLHEELDELERADNADEREDEIGDLFFVLVNLARFYKVDPEQALRRTNAKFKKRFSYVERRLEAEGRAVTGTPVAELETYWQEAKQRT